jgi:uncharacterized DUF497 family protein
MLDLQFIDGFDWDEGNRDKNWVRHKVAIGECEEVFFNLPLVIADDLKHSEVEKRYLALGQTNDKRLLFLSFAVRNKKIRIISARDMSRKERKVYAQANP